MEVDLSAVMVPDTTGDDDIADESDDRPEAELDFEEPAERDPGADDEKYGQDRRRLILII